MEPGKEADVNSDERKEILAAEADERIRKGSHWSDWGFIADGFAVGRSKAMHASGSNKPYGKGYTEKFAAWMAERPWAKRIDKSTRNHLLWVADHRSEIEAWRETLAQNERDKLNHPTNLKRKFESAQRVSAKDPALPKKETNKDALVRALDEAHAEIKRLKADGGSLFDCRKSPLKTIARIMGEEMGLERLVSAQKEIAKEIARLKGVVKGNAAQAG